MKKGTKHNKESRRKMGLCHIGKIPPNYKKEGVGNLCLR